MNNRGTMIDPEYDRRYIEFTPEQLQALADMYRDGKSTRALGRRYGISPTTVSRRLESMGVELRGRGKNHVSTDRVLETARRMRSEGHGWKAVSAATGVLASSIMGAIRRERRRSTPAL